MLAASFVLVSGHLVIIQPDGALSNLIHTAVLAFVSLQLGQASFALLVMRLLIDRCPLTAHAEHAVVLCLEAAQLLRQLMPDEAVEATWAFAREYDFAAHGVGLAPWKIGFGEEGGSGDLGYERQGSRSGFTKSQIT